MRPLLAGAAAVVMALGASAMVAADPTLEPAGQPADVCLEVAAGALSDEDWTTVAAAVAEAVARRPALFPRPHLERELTRLDVASGHSRPEAGYGGCLQPAREWTARFGREFLEVGADQMLAEAPTTPGIDSDVTIEWVPEETRLRTRLDFAGPLDIPNGTCWIDDSLTVDPAAGSVVAGGERGVETSPFAEGACGRFFDHLPDGGAGQQAVELLPRVVRLADGSELRFMAEHVIVSEDGLAVSGRLERG